MSYAIVTGALFRDPEQRTAKTGTAYTVATIREKTGDASTFWRVTAFSQSAQDELARLRDGDAISAQGQLKVETYQKDGETKISLSLVADAILPLRRAKKPKLAAETAEQPRRRSTAEMAGNGGGRYAPAREPRQWGGSAPADDPFGDQMPF